MNSHHYEVSLRNVSCTGSHVICFLGEIHVVEPLNTDLPLYHIIFLGKPKQCIHVWYNNECEHYNCNVIRQ